MEGEKTYFNYTDANCNTSDSFIIRTLAQFLRAQAKPLSEKEILRMFSQMVDALLYLHGHKILHRYVLTVIREFFVVKNFLFHPK